jgi:hypothetical protein
MAIKIQNTIFTEINVNTYTYAGLFNFVLMYTLLTLYCANFNLITDSTAPTTDIPHVFEYKKILIIKSLSQAPTRPNEH